MKELLFEKDESCHGEHDRGSDENAEVDDGNGEARLQDGNHNHDGKRKHCDDRKSGHPGAIAVVFIGFAVKTEAATEDSQQHEDGPRRNVGSVVPAADEVFVLFDGAVFDCKPEVVEENCASVEEVEATPVA